MVQELAGGGPLTLVQRTGGTMEGPAEGAREEAAEGEASASILLGDGVLVTARAPLSGASLRALLDTLR